MKENSFITLTPGFNVIKLFFFVTAAGAISLALALVLGRFFQSIPVFE
jgi:hypothetical protein